MGRLDDDDDDVWRVVVCSIDYQLNRMQPDGFHNPPSTERSHNDDEDDDEEEEDYE